MNVRASLLPVALIVLSVPPAGCTRNQTRRDTGRGVPAQPSALDRDNAPQAPVAAPVPPTPPPLPRPAEPPVAPPKADAISGIVPPMPGSPEPLPALGGQLASPVAQAGATGPDAGTDDDRKTLRERIQERREQRRERREERREQRQNPDPAKPDTPTTPPKPADPAPKADPARPGTSTPPPAGGNADLAAVRKLVEASAKRYADVTDFEARLVKQEVVKGKQLPREEMVYRFRKQPLSVYMKVTSEAGQGREVMYVQGHFGNQMHVVTGKGDNRLVGAGFKTELSPDDSRATEKSRYRIYEAGFGRTIGGLTKQLEGAEKGQASAIRPLGQVQRKEYPYPLEGVEITIKPGEDHQLPKGGKREVFFDPKPDSPSHLLPVLVVTTEPDGRQVEYYCFDQFRLPAGTTDADWNPDRLGGKRK